MNSEDEIDAKSTEDNSSDGDREPEYSDDGGDSGSPDGTVPTRGQKSYLVLDEADVRKRQWDDITSVSAVLSVSISDARILLRHYHWSVGDLEDAWFSDEDGVRKAVGLLERPIDQSSDAKLESGEDEDKYVHYMTKRCPAPDCKYAVKFVEGGKSGVSYDVSCLCSYEFCWNCTREAHRPVDCGTASRWLAESESVRWLLDNCRPCPQCKQLIEKTGGCLLVACPCGFIFCWSCLVPWSDQHRGSANVCELYQYNEWRRREAAKKTVDSRCAEFYTRWEVNEKSRQKALKNLREIQTVHTWNLIQQLSLQDSQLHFIAEAWVQIAECRRVLKWAYAYGYYLPDHEVSKRKFFIWLVGEAEAGLTRLYECALMDLRPWLLMDGADFSVHIFRDFCNKLVGLVMVARKYFENLVSAIKNDLLEVDSKGGVNLFSVADGKYFFSDGLPDEDRKGDNLGLADLVESEGEDKKATTGSNNKPGAEKKRSEMTEEEFSRLLKELSRIGDGPTKSYTD